MRKLLVLFAAAAALAVGACDTDKAAGPDARPAAHAHHHHKADAADTTPH